MIAKLIAHGPTRAEAFARLGDALAETEVGGVTTNLPFLRWLVAHPVVLAGEATTAFLTEYPPLSEPPLRLPDAAWRGGWRLNLPPAAPCPAPDVDSAAHDHVAGAGGESRVTAPMPGTVISVNVAVGRPRRGAPPAARARGDEDGDAADGALRRDGQGRARRGGRPRRRRRPPRRAGSGLVAGRGRAGRAGRAQRSTRRARARRARCGREQEQRPGRPPRSASSPSPRRRGTRITSSTSLDDVDPAGCGAAPALESGPCAAIARPIRFALRLEEEDPGQEGDREADEAENDPEDAERPRPLDREQDPEHEHASDDGNEEPLREPLGAARRAACMKAAVVASARARTLAVESERDPAAEPDDRGEDVQEEENLVDRIIARRASAASSRRPCRL